MSITLRRGQEALGVYWVGKEVIQSRAHRIFPWESDISETWGWTEALFTHLQAWVAEKGMFLVEWTHVQRPRGHSGCQVQGSERRLVYLELGAWRGSVERWNWCGRLFGARFWSLKMMRNHPKSLIRICRFEESHSGCIFLSVILL